MSTALSDQNAGTTQVREGFTFDERALEQWLRENVDGYEGPLRVEQFRGGQSNPTYKLVTPRHSYVLRRKPPGHLLPGAHAIEREAEVLTALGRACFPVPRVHGLCSDTEVIGTSFYVMDLVAGRIFWDAAFPDVAREKRPAYFDEMNATIARLHRLDYQALGLEGFGKPGNYFERQIARWSRQYCEDVDAGRDTSMDELIVWLPDNIPPGDDTTIVHGDFRCGNMIFHSEKPEIVAVLDWELSTLGHPLSDFCYHSLMYRIPPEIVPALGSTKLVEANIPTEEEYIRSYCERTGRDGIACYDFYVAFNLFRLAAIFHGIKGRVIRGTAASSQARERAASFPVLARMAWVAAQACR